MPSFDLMSYARAAAPRMSVTVSILSSGVYGPKMHAFSHGKGAPSASATRVPGPDATAVAMDWLIAYALRHPHCERIAAMEKMSEVTLQALVATQRSIPRHRREAVSRTGSADLRRARIDGGVPRQPTIHHGGSYGEGFGCVRCTASIAFSTSSDKVTSVLLRFVSSCAIVVAPMRLLATKR